MTTELDTKALRAQYEAATPGEWEASEDVVKDAHGMWVADCFHGDATLIVTMHSTYAALLDGYERVDKYEAALRGVMPLIDEFGDTQAYGPFPGGDPRNFVPDDEDCSPQEIAAWKAACAEWDAGNGEDRGPSCATMGDGSAWSGTGFGMGVYTWPTPPEVRAAREALGEPDAD